MEILSGDIRKGLNRARSKEITIFMWSKRI